MHNLNATIYVSIKTFLQFQEGIVKGRKMKITQVLLSIAGVFALVGTAHADNSSGTAAVMDPVEAMELVLSEPLTYVGQFYPTNSLSGKIPSCLYRNAKVTVMYTYCRRAEAPAFGMTVYSNTVERGQISFYAEGDGTPVSQLSRDEYSMYMWRMISRFNAPGYRAGMTAKEYAAYHEKELTYYNSGCHIWQSYGKPVDAKCLSVHEAQAPAWLSVSMDFWNQPNQAWYDVQKYLRSLIKGNSAIP